MGPKFGVSVQDNRLLSGAGVIVSGGRGLLECCVFCLLKSAN